MLDLERTIGLRTPIACAGVAAFAIVSCASPQQKDAVPSEPRSQSARPSPGNDAAPDDYADGARALTEEERLGRDTWNFWTAGDQRLWRRVAGLTRGNVDLLMYADSRMHDRRFETLGVINHPGCRAASGPDRYGLWLDDCTSATEAPAIPGRPVGIVGLRRFDNPSFDPAKWNLQAYLDDRASVEPPYLVGMSCGFCHIGFNPLDPPADLNRPAWKNLDSTISNQYFDEGKVFSQNMTPSDFRWHVANTQPRGTSDTSRLATDHINNPNTINAIADLPFRPTAVEKMADGSTRPVPHILKDGADSIGLAGAAMRVYANIGMCGEYALTLHDPIDGVKRAQRPFEMARARMDCDDWRQTEARIPAVAAFLKTARPLHLAAAPGGAAYLTADPEVLHRGKIVFADTCAPCHSSKQPPPDTQDTHAWYRASVLAEDFLTDNFLSNDRRYPVTVIGTNIGRAAASNATRGHIWAEFSSETYKELPAVGTVKGLYNPRDPSHPVDFALPGGGRGYYRPPSLASLWATAPYLHTNAVGLFNRDPSVKGRMEAFNDAIEKMLWPEKRPGIRSIAVTTEDSVIAIPGTTRTLRVPKGTPVDYIARVDPAELAREVAAVPMVNLLLALTPDDVLLSALSKRNLAPDFVRDRGHAFGATLPDEDKRALIALLKTF